MFCLVNICLGNNYFFIWAVERKKGKHFFYFCHVLRFEITPRKDDDICDVMGQNQSHVAKHETAQICILSENVKICPFSVFNKNEIFD